MSLLNEIDRYMAETGMAATTFGRKAVRDPRLVLDMRLGRRLRPATRARVAALLAER